MRTTNEIIVAVQECQPVEIDELKMALMVESSVTHFYRTALQGLIEAVESDKGAKLRAAFAKRTIEDMFRAHKTDPQKWLGPANTPGTEENKSRREWAKRVFEKATGEKIE